MKELRDISRHDLFLQISMQDMIGQHKNLNFLIKIILKF